VDGPTDTARVDAILQAASNTIDSYIARRYQTPLSPVPAVITDNCCKLARYALASGGQSTPSDQMRDDRKDAMRWLESVAAGNAALLDANPISPSSSFAQTSDRPALFQPRRQGGLY
jgi:phage gp36-like protein